MFDADHDRRQKTDVRKAICLTTAFNLQGIVHKESACETPAFLSTKMYVQSLRPFPREEKKRTAPKIERRRSRSATPVPLHSVRKPTIWVVGPAQLSREGIEGDLINRVELVSRMLVFCVVHGEGKGKERKAKFLPVVLKRKKRDEVGCMWRTHVRARVACVACMAALGAGR